MVRKSIVFAVLAVLSSPAIAGAPIWQNVESGMTVAQVHALYPAGRADGRFVEYHDKLTELHGFLTIGRCHPRVEIQHPKGVVTGVYIWMRPQGAFVPMCAADARAAALAKFGEPLTTHSKNALPGDAMHGDEETLSWLHEGIAVTFFHENRDDGWHIQYKAGAAGDAAGL